MGQGQSPGGEGSSWRQSFLILNQCSSDFESSRSFCVYLSPLLSISATNTTGIPCLDRWQSAICFQLSQCQVVDTLFLTRVWTHRPSGGRGKRHHRTRIKRSRFKSWSTHLWAVYHCCTVMPLFTTCGRTMATMLVCPFTHLTRVYYTTIACNYSPGP